MPQTKKSKSGQNGESHHNCACNSCKEKQKKNVGVRKNPVLTKFDSNKKPCKVETEKDEECKCEECKCVDCRDSKIKQSSYRNNNLTRVGSEKMSGYDITFIQKSDSLSSLLKKYNTDSQTLKNLNGGYIPSSGILKVPRQEPNLPTLFQRPQNNLADYLSQKSQELRSRSPQFKVPTWVVPNDSIEVDGKRVFVSEIVNRAISFKRSIPSYVYDSLDDNEKVILDLPIMMVKMKMYYAAFCAMYWLDPDRDERGKEKINEENKVIVKFPFESVIKYKRAKVKLDEAIEEFDNAQWLTYSDYIKYINSKYESSGLASTYLYHSSKKPVENAINSILTNLNSGKIDCVQINDLDKSKRLVKDMTLFNIVELGSVFGDLDDLGAAWGRFTFRMYYNGVITKNDTESKKYKSISKGVYTLKVTSAKVRAWDEYEFGKGSGWEPLDKWQILGVWKWDLNNPEVLKNPGYSVSDAYFLLQNSTFRSLSEKLTDGCNKKIGRDFYIASYFYYLNEFNLPDCIKHFSQQ